MRQAPTHERQSKSVRTSWEGPLVATRDTWTIAPTLSRELYAYLKCYFQFSTGESLPQHSRVILKRLAQRALPLIKQSEHRHQPSGLTTTPYTNKVYSVNHKTSTLHTMELLDLPPELFQQVAHDLVEVAGITDAWQLRGVCRTFAAEISHDIFAKRKTWEFTSYRDRRFLRLAVHRYLAARLHHPLDIDKRFLDKIRIMVDWAASVSHAKTASQKDEIAEKICAVLNTSTGGLHLLHVLQCGSTGCYIPWYNWSKQELDMHDRLTSAVSIERYDLVEEMLSELSDAVQVSWFVFQPFEIALEHGDKLLLETTFRFLKSVSEAGNLAFTASQELRIKGVAPLKVHNAVSIAIMSNQTESLQCLLDFSKQYLPRPDKSVYERWVFRAMGSGKDCLINLLDFKPNGKSMVTRQILTTVCHYGTAQMIRDVTNRMGKDINTGTILTLPIFIAVRCGTPATVESVLDAGADVGIKARSNIPSLTKSYLTPLDVAIYHHQDGIVDVLLKRGAGPLPHITEWPQHHRTFNYLRRIVSKDSGIDLPTLKQFRALTLEKRKSIVH